MQADSCRVIAEAKEGPHNIVIPEPHFETALLLFFLLAAKTYAEILAFEEFSNEKFLITFTIRLVFRISVLFIIGPLVPIPGGFWDQTLINIPLQ